MSKSARITLGITTLIFIGFGLVYLGIVLGSSGWLSPLGRFQLYDMPMFSRSRTDSCDYTNDPDHYGMGGYVMMGENYSNSNIALKPLTIDEVDQVIHEYLEEISNEDLILGEIMIFDNHAYAEIIEKSTGIGAMEVLIDPQTRSVYPEQGPNMKWNLKYSPMGNLGQGLDMRSDSNAAEINNMPVSSSQAVNDAQNFLDQYHPGTQADEHTDPFYGYYTLHILREDNVVGMLSVNGFTGQIFYHDWHGEFIEMSEH